MRAWHKKEGSSLLGTALVLVALLVIPYNTLARQENANPQLDFDQIARLDQPQAVNDSPVGDLAQEASPKPDEPPSVPSAADKAKEALAVNPATGRTVSPASNYIPLTGKQRWRLYWKQNFHSAGAYTRPIFFALVIDQATNSPAAWGDGFGGFGRRLGSRIASNIVQGTIRAPIAALLHEDIRYISNQRGKRRLLHAIEYSFLTYNNRGRPTLNIAKLAGYYSSTAISTAWRPGHYDLASYTFSNGTI